MDVYFDNIFSDLAMHGTCLSFPGQVYGTELAPQTRSRLHYLLSKSRGRLFVTLIENVSP
jgi:hypothetical protein